MSMNYTCEACFRCEYFADTVGEFLPDYVLARLSCDE